MLVIPAIDLIDGKCVRLYQGDFSKTMAVGGDPVDQLHQFVKSGAKMVHIVDLDGARNGAARQYELIRLLCNQSTVPIQVGGGIRTMETVEKLLEAGATRLVLGTSALEDEVFLDAALQKYSSHIVVGIDAKDEMVATRGWETITETHYIDFAKKMEEKGVETIVFTDISRDGTLTGPNLQQLEAIKNAVHVKIVASGGVKDNQDLEDLKAIGIEEAIVGKAIYDGKVTVMGDI
ncbi:1-(5-phosphoribosyl)-5-[(5-phosphoribosylamino)methylideneamino]imidazole-4-carboxamide isomerase [Radiobacillus kanasensis]|uniref:1-(5-phosphoribosyl)-5-[(5- phosphoribosylamino)methylideneamino]imidazole-4- carboxamide isomerase n=1 Tax=Radiobacillus kanasensis TaxID=2844358 RepID=UPI001E439A28|nr:1-(5-phosphoribosyl)-5-[(5-phosphoribosylamino)methylideneamino]imidazole-4-carboxamide isomerase [Radiobacillus kanasensis]UFU01165.1 1-(5-phosphoribosyl)-5-[(5-phosphoribosylamino)methylideneamino]imidazole-4-carboxamide isomerase [Radiobacillus kanasensis]